MNPVPESIWIAACAHRLQQQWRSVDPVVLEEAAWDIWRDPKLRELEPEEAARVWLEPIQIAVLMSSSHTSSRH